jgi:hypothetical protein
VADREIEQLIVDRVDTLCKGIESGADKRGQVMFIHFTSQKKSDSWDTDNRHFLGKAAEKVVVPGVYG